MLVYESNATGIQRKPKGCHIHRILAATGVRSHFGLRTKSKVAAGALGRVDVAADDSGLAVTQLHSDTVVMLFHG